MSTSIAEALDLMRHFARRTGLAEPAGGRRYLWTDAFAICNFLGLAAATGDAGLATLARSLVARVHDSLGRHRGDGGRTGWLPGASGEHPTRGGLRIGKPLPERGPHEPLDERREWDRDGQYFHYLTKWMHALDRMARSTREAAFHHAACDLAAAAHRAFTCRAPGRPPRMYWKMSIDLSRPLVASMGQHDPLDGWITCVQLTTPAAGHAAAGEAPDLRNAAADYRAMLAGAELATADPLGLGGLLADACRVAQLARDGADFAGEPLLETLLAAAARGLDVYARGGAWRSPPARRLAFRELGLAIGLDGVAWLRTWSDLPSVASSRARASLDHLAPFAPVRDEIVGCWRDPGNRTGPAWSDHEDINAVMLATALAPAGFLVLDPA